MCGRTKLLISQQPGSRERKEQNPSHLTRLKISPSPDSIIQPLVHGLWEEQTITYDPNHNGLESLLRKQQLRKDPEERKAQVRRRNVPGVAEQKLTRVW